MPIKGFITRIAFDAAETKEPVNKTALNERGQTLLFVVVAVTIALAIGVSVSTRTLNLSSRISRTDTAQRVIAAAEGGIERLLTENEVVLESLTNRPLTDPNFDCSNIGIPNDVPDGCLVQFEPSEGDNIIAQANVKVETFNTNSKEGDHYWFNLDPGYVKEVVLEGYDPDTIEVCWDNIDVALYFISYDSSCGVEKNGLIHETFAGVKEDKDISGFGIASKPSREGFDVCGDVSLISNSVGLRVRVLYDTAKVAVFPENPEDFPDQGYKMISKGELAVNNEVVAVKTIYLYKSFSYAPAFFDYGLYTTGSIQ